VTNAIGAIPGQNYHLLVLMAKDEIEIRPLRRLFTFLATTRLLPNHQRSESRDSKNVTKNWSKPAAA